MQISIIIIGKLPFLVQKCPSKNSMHIFTIMPLQWMKKYKIWFVIKAERIFFRVFSIFTIVVRFLSISKNFVGLILEPLADVILSAIKSKSSTFCLIGNLRPPRLFSKMFQKWWKINEVNCIKSRFKLQFFGKIMKK